MRLAIARYLKSAACACSGIGGRSSVRDELRMAEVDRAFAGAGLTNILTLGFALTPSGSIWISASGTFGVI